MADSLITRCPKCSTAFRVSDEVLSMAKGKVRCGQCFHIFNASEAANSKTAQKPSAPSKAQPQQQPQPQTNAAEQNTAQKAPSEPNEGAQQATIENRLAPAEDIINPDWLHTLFNDDDLQPPGQHSSKAKTNNAALEESIATGASNAHQEPVKTQAQKAEAGRTRQEEPAPWEVELAEVEAALKATPQQTTTTNKPAPKPEPSVVKETATAAKETPTTAKETAEKASPPEPDYMIALHSLAQTAAEQTRPSDIKNQHSILEQLSAQQSLAPLMGESETSQHKKNRHPWLWFFASLLGVALLATQVALHFFDEGSRSSNFRAIYKTICSYTGCVLPGFEDISAISIQHVRIQSHPTIPNTLLVNAIITNTSNFSQPMPKIALEFFDLNGLPVAARLFSPNDYLHKDFLDITYMPPNTPIHLVIPIQDPGARAVTHQLRAFPANTRSY